MTITDAITAIAVAFSAIFFIGGVNAWKREFIGKRRMELIETVLALFYEAQDTIQNMRFRASFEGEGETRKRSENENEKETVILNRAYIAFERYKNKEKLFAELRSMKYRIMATFGSNAGKPFDELSQVLSDIFLSAQFLGDYFWQGKDRETMDEDERKKNLEETRYHESRIWFKGAENDEISLRIQQAIEKIESMAEETFSK